MLNEVEYKCKSCKDVGIKAAKIRPDGSVAKTMMGCKRKGCAAGLEVTKRRIRDMLYMAPGLWDMNHYSRPGLHHQRIDRWSFGIWPKDDEIVELSEIL